jgi:hypothetical protein
MGDFMNGSAAREQGTNNARLCRTARRRDQRGITHSVLFIDQRAHVQQEADDPWHIIHGRGGERRVACFGAYFININALPQQLHSFVFPPASDRRDQFVRWHCGGRDHGIAPGFIFLLAAPSRSKSLAFCMSTVATARGKDPIDLDSGANTHLLRDIIFGFQMVMKKRDYDIKRSLICQSL